MAIVLLDSDVLIELFLESTEAVNWLKGQHGESVATSVVSVMEVLVGARKKKERGELWRRLTSYKIVQINEKDSGLAVNL